MNKSQPVRPDAVQVERPRTRRKVEPTVPSIEVRLPKYAAGQLERIVDLLAELIVADLQIHNTDQNRTTITETEKE